MWARGAKAKVMFVKHKYMKGKVAVEEATKADRGNNV